MSTRVPALEERVERLTPELVLVCPELARFDPEFSPEAEEPTPALRLAPPPEQGRPRSFGPGGIQWWQPRTQRRRRPRLLLPFGAIGLALVGGLSAATLTFATTGGSEPRRPASPPAQAQPEVLEVPSVVGKQYVFAKGMLQDGGFAWRVEGNVQGFAANLVSAQEPPAEMKVVDTGSPTIVLRLNRSAEYDEHGIPENSAPYEGTEVVLARTPEPRAQTAPPPTPEATVEKEPAEKRGPREPDFAVPGAPPEPANEMPLTERAFLLASWLANKSSPTKAVVAHWNYQHAWIVSGARFGWHGGADALRILIEIDRDLQARWGIGARSEAVARAALKQVQRKRRG